MMINAVYLFYDNPLMLQMQIDCWNSYVGVLNELPEILLIDDGSPRSFAAEVVKKHCCQLPIKVFRIRENIAWNFAGARNLGCTHANDWIYVSDIDTLLPPMAAKAFFEDQPLDEQCFYLPKRVWLPDYTEATIAQVNLLFHKSKFLEIGGYDEDFSGQYAVEDTDFYNRIKKSAKRVFRDDIVVQAVPPEMVTDARTVGLRRDKTFNRALLQKKEVAGLPKPVNPLRFTWERVL